MESISIQCRQKSVYCQKASDVTMYRPNYFLDQNIIQTF